MEGLALGVTIVVTKLKEADTDGMAVEELGKLCFREALNPGNTWFASTDEEWFQIGAGALAVIGGEEVQAKIKKTFDVMCGIVAMTQGVPVDLNKLMGEEDIEEKTLPLRSWYDDVKKEGDG